MQNAVGLFDFPTGRLPGFVGHIGLQELQQLHGQLVQPFTALSRQAEASLLHVPLQRGQVDLNQLVTWILNQWQLVQGGTLSSSANTGIDIFDLQQVKVDDKKFTYISWYIPWYIS